jgi:penicillin amidase
MALADWDGRYGPKSLDATRFEIFAFHLSGAFGQRVEQTAYYYRSWNYLAHHLIEDVRRLPAEVQDEIAVEALANYAADEMLDTPWGEWHRLRAAHPLVSVPVIGDRFVRWESGAGGSRETVMKTAHNLTRETHYATYGSQSRHISQMDDPDHNYFLVFGGQDGWLGSENFSDQAELWQTGAYLQLPLRAQTAAGEYRFEMKLAPDEQTQLIDRGADRQATLWRADLNGPFPGDLSGNRSVEPSEQQVGAPSPLPETPETPKTTGED